MKRQIAKIDEQLRKNKNKIGLAGTRLKVHEVEGNSFSAHITDDWREMDLSYGKELDLVPDKQTQGFVKKRQITNPDLKIGEDILDHEAGHRENRVGEKTGCPYNIETHEEIKDAVSRALNSIGKSGLEGYVTNAFEDVLDNINCRRHTDFGGQTLFWNNQGIVNAQEGKFSPFYEAFVRVNLMLGEQVSDCTLLKRFFNNSPKVRKAINHFLQDVKKISKEESLVGLHKKPGFYDLFNPKDLEARAGLWANLGYSFAIHLGELIENQPEEEMFSFVPNPFDSQMKMPDNRQKVIFRRYQQGKGLASHRDSFEQLYDLYKIISKEIPVESSHYTSSQSMPLTGFGRRFVKEDEQKFKFKGIGYDDEGNLKIKTSRHHIEFPVSFIVHTKKFPKFKLALMDRSGSMRESTRGDDNVGDTSCIPWGDESKYHFALKGYFGMDNFFERQGIINYIENRVFGFSGESVLRGKANDVAKKLLTMPSGGTELNISQLEKELESEALVLSISDGEFYIDENEETKLRKKLVDCDYAHIQIGQDTDFSSYLKSINIPVINVKGDNDLSNAMVSFVSGYYKSISQGGNP